MPFWKYKDKSLDEVAKIDMNYIYYYYELSIFKTWPLDHELISKLENLKKENPLNEVESLKFWKYTWKSLKEICIKDFDYLVYILGLNKKKEWMKDYALIESIEKITKEFVRNKFKK